MTSSTDSLNPEPLIALHDVRKVYRQSGGLDVEALRGVTLALKPGRLVAVVGPSGSGKSTLLNLLGSLDTPTGGRLLFDGRDIALLSERERTRFRAANVGFIFQFFNLLPGLTSAQNVALGGVIAGMHAAGARERARSLLDLVGLADKAGTPARDLSGGQMQRVTIARALVNDPRLVLADEPTGNLDRRNAEEILQVLRHRAGDGRAIVMVTHNHELAERYADELVTLHDGRLVNGRDPDEEVREPEPARAAANVVDHPRAPESGPLRSAAPLEAGLVELEVGPVAGAEDLVGIQRAIERIDGLETVSLERLLGGRATFSVRIVRSAALVAQILALHSGTEDPGAGRATVREASGDRIVVDLDDRQGKSRRSRPR